MEDQLRQHSALCAAHRSHCARVASQPRMERGSGRGGYLPDQSEAKAPAPRAGGPSLTPAVGGEGGASCAAAEGAGPGAWRRGLGLSVPRPPLPLRLLICRGWVAAGAADRRPPPRHPEPPSAVPGRRAGKAGRTAEPSRPQARQRSAARAPPRGCVSSAAPFASRGRSRGAGRPFSPSPSHLPAPRLQKGPRAAPPHPGVGLVPRTPVSGRLHNRWGWERGSLPEPRPHTCPCAALAGRGQTPSTTVGAWKVSLCGPGLLTSERCGEMEAERRGCASPAALALPRVALVQVSFPEVLPRALLWAGGCCRAHGSLRLHVSWPLACSILGTAEPLALPPFLIER